MGNWSFLTNHGKVLVCIARDPEARLRDIADRLGITERTTFAIVNDLAEAGYMSKDRDGRRNRYKIHTQQPLGEGVARELAIGEMLELLADTDTA